MNKKNAGKKQGTKQDAKQEIKNEIKKDTKNIIKDTKKDTLKEADLYEPICKYLKARGYIVHAEVKSCDIAALKDEELVIVEMKTAFNLKLLTQAVKRQRATDSVYVAVPRPKGGKKGSSWRDMCLLLRRLEIGLILVNIDDRQPEVEIAFHPNTFDRLKSKASAKRTRHSIIKEAEARYGDYNKGGSTRCRIMTSYKESCLHIACCLDRLGTLSPAQLKKLGTGHKTQSILSKNFYGWYDKVAKGKYALNPEAQKFIENYPELAAHYYSKIEEVPADK